MRRGGGGGRPAPRSLTGEADPVARVGDLSVVVPTLRGKVEFEMGTRAGNATCSTTWCGWRSRRCSATGSAASTSSALITRFDEGTSVEDGDLVP
jgi:magnesium chelatase subunit I